MASHGLSRFQQEQIYKKKPNISDIFTNFVMSEITSSDRFVNCSKQSHINELTTKTTCSIINTSENFHDKNLNDKVDILKTEFSDAETERKLYEYKNVLEYYSDYELYDEKNSLLTNLNEFGLHFFDTNAEIEENNINIDKYLNDSLSNLNNFCDTASSKRLENIDSHNDEEASKYDETYNDIDKNITDVGISNDILVNNSKILSNIKTNIKYGANTEADKAAADKNICNFSRLYNPIDSDKIFEIDIEDKLKCNLIVKGNYNKSKIEKVIADINDDTKINDCIDVKTIEDTTLVEDVCLNANQSDDSDTCSYHSSDFEFISESEACNGSTAGLMYNLNPSSKVIKNISPVTVEISSEIHTNINDFLHKPEHGVSQNIAIPRGNDYYNLFQYPCVPYPCKNIENKADHSVKGMNVGDTRFDMKSFLHQRDSNSIKLKEEADESAKIIVSMYPYENRRISLRTRDK